MVGAGVEGKKLKIGEEEGEGEENNHIDEGLVLSIEKLQEIQDELERIDEEASEKVLEVEQKYSEIRKPVYEKRNDIIKTIPDFWYTAFVSHPALAALLTEEDHKIFKYLSSLEVEDSKDLKSGYSISFNFQVNPYFEETKLTKIFTFLEDDTTEITSTPIKWKEGMGIPNGVTSEKKGNKRPLPDEGFFAWFSNYQIGGMPDEFAEIIKEDLWPNPLPYFNNEADDEESDGVETDDVVSKGAAVLRSPKRQLLKEFAPSSKPRALALPHPQIDSMTTTRRAPRPKNQAETPVDTRPTFLSEESSNVSNSMMNAAMIKRLKKRSEGLAFSLSDVYGKGKR